MFGFFGWVRRAMKAAVLGGVQDAVDTLALSEGDDAPAVTLRLTFRPVEEKADAPARKRKEG